MAYQSGQPADSSRIRDFASLTRENFEAIEDGTSSNGFSQLNVNVKIGGETTEVADWFRLYAATDSSETALYGKTYDGSGGNSIQFTENEFLGATSQKLRATSLNFDALTYGDGTTPVANTQQGQATAWGFFTGAGATISAYNCSCSKDSTGKYTISFTNAMNNANYVVSATTRAGTSNAGRAIDIQDSSVTYDVNGFKVITRNRGGSPTETDTAFSVVVYGGLV